MTPLGYSFVLRKYSYFFNFFSEGRPPVLCHSRVQYLHVQNKGSVYVSDVEACKMQTNQKQRSNPNVFSREELKTSPAASQNDSSELAVFVLTWFY